MLSAPCALADDQTLTAGFEPILSDLGGYTVQLQNHSNSPIEIRDLMVDGRRECSTVVGINDLWGPGTANYDADDRSLMHEIWLKTGSALISDQKNWDNLPYRTLQTGDTETWQTGCAPINLTVTTVDDTLTFSFNQSPAANPGQLFREQPDQDARYIGLGGEDIPKDHMRPRSTADREAFREAQPCRDAANDMTKMLRSHLAVLVPNRWMAASNDFGITIREFGPGAGGGGIDFNNDQTLDKILSNGTNGADKDCVGPMKIEYDVQGTSLKEDVDVRYGLDLSSSSPKVKWVEILDVSDGNGPFQLNSGRVSLALPE